MALRLSIDGPPKPRDGSYQDEEDLRDADVREALVEMRERTIVKPNQGLSLIPHCPSLPVAS